METLNCKTDIVNRALSLLREKEIVDVNKEAESDTEKLIYKWYETAKAECITEIEPPFAIKRLKLNVEKIVDEKTLEEIKDNRNTEISFTDWMKSVIENDVDELEKEFDKTMEYKLKIEAELLDELNKLEENQDKDFILNTKRKIRNINLDLIILKERIKFLVEEYNLKNDILEEEIKNLQTELMNLETTENTTNENENTNVNENTNTNENTEGATTVPATPLQPTENTLLIHILKEKKIKFLKELKRQSEIRRYEEYEAWKDYCNKNKKQKNNYLYAYRIPADCLKIFDKNFEFMEGNYIYSYQENSLVIKYLSNNTELYKREVKFNLALSYVLAYYTCADLTNNDNKIQLFLQLKEKKISEARTNNLREIGVKIIKNYRWKK